MKVFVKVKPRAKQEKVEKTSEDRFTIWVKVPPTEGRGNYAVVRLIAEYFGISVSRVQIISGLASRHKIVEVA